MNIDLGAIDVAERFQHAEALRLEYIPAMVLIDVLGPGDCKPELEWHIESRCARPSVVRLDPREVMERILTSGNQLGQTIQPAMASRDLQHGLWSQAKTAQPCNESQV